MRSVLFILVALIFTFCTSPKPTTTVTEEKKVEKKSDATKVTLKKGLQIGDQAPTFKLMGIDGEAYTYENIMDGNGKAPKGYIVIFTCNTCPVAKINEERIIELHNKYAKKGYPVVAIQPNDPSVKPGDSYDAMISYAKDKGFPFVYLFDKGQQVYPKYGAKRTPEVFLVDKSLKVRYHGAIDDSVRDPENVEVKYLENAIDAIENGKEPEPTKTKAIGCTIKTT